MGSSVNNVLNIHAPWSEVLSILDVEVHAEQLPTRVVCPICRKPRLHVFEDNISGGAWHYCSACQSSGDMITLAANTWNTSSAGAIRRLMQNGIYMPEEHISDESIGRYILHHPQAHSRFKDFWRRCQEALPENKSLVIAKLREKFRLTAGNMDAKQWMAGPGNLLGCMDRISVEAAFSACVRRHIAEGDSRPNVYRPAKQDTLPGAGWKDVLAIQFEDMPGRPCGFLFIGREGELSDRVYRYTDWHNRGKGRNPKQSVQPKKRVAEAGLAGLWAVEHSRGIAEEVVAVGDPLLALRLQIRQFGLSSVPLPLVSYYHGHNAVTGQAPWKTFAGRQIVIFGFKLTADMLLQAVRSNGLLSTANMHNPSQETIHTFLRNNEPRDIIRKVIKHAIPWRAFFADWAAGASDRAVLELVEDLKTYGVDPEQLHVSQRLRDLTATVAPPKELRLGRIRVWESNGKTWFLDPKDKFTGIALGFQIRITGTVVKDVVENPGTRGSVKIGNRDVVHYKITILFKDREILLEIPMTSFKQKARKQIEDAVAREFPGELPYFDSHFQGAGRIVDIATGFGLQL